MSQKFLNGVSVDGGNITVGESNATNNHVKVFHSDETYTELHGFGIITDRTSYYIRPSTDGTQTLYVGGADAGLDWSTINFKYNNSISFVKNGTTIFNLNSSNNATFAGKILNSYTGTGYHELQNSTSNGTVLRLLSTGDSRTLTLQTDHIYSNGDLYFGDNSHATNFRGSSYNFSTGNATFAADLQIGTFGNNNAEFALGQTIANKVFAYGAEIQTTSSDIQLVLGRNDGTSVVGTGGIGASATNAFHVYDTTSIAKLFEVAQTSGNATVKGSITAAQHFKATASNISFHAGGTQVLNIDVNKNIYPSVDGDTDLGFSDSSYRFRNGYFTGELQGGSLDINGDADISGQVKVTSDIFLNPDYVNANEYLYLRKHQSGDGGIIFQSKTSGGSTQSDFQIRNQGTTGDLKFYAYGLAGEALILDRENGNATFAGTITASGYNNSNWDTAYTHSQAAHAPSNAEQNVQADWNATSGDAQILNKLNREFVANEWGDDRFKRTVTGTNTTAGSTGDTWVKLSSVDITSAYHKVKIKFSIGSSDDNARGREQIDVLYENDSTAQENHQLRWYAGDDLPTLFKAVKSIRSASSGTSNTYDVYVQMEQDWQDNFTVHAEWWRYGGSISYPTTEGSSTTPTAGSDDKSLTSRQRWVDADLLDGQQGTHYLDYGNFTNTPTIPTDFVSAASGGTFTGDLNVHTNAGTGALSVGRASDQAIKLYVSDTVNTIYAYQDSDGNSDHQFILRRDFLGTGASDFKIQNGSTSQLLINKDGQVTIPGNAIISGNLTVNGTTTTLNTQTVEVEDNILQLNTTQGSPDTATAATSGISVYRGDGVTQASLIFDDADDFWDLTHNLKVAGNFTSGGYVEATSYLYLRNNIRLLNKAGTNWLTFANRNTAATEAVYDLANIGTITNSGDINTSGDVHIDDGSTSAFQTTNKLRFGNTAWNNNIGIESYWMVLGCNQNEGFKFRDSASNMLLQLNGGNNTSGNGAFSATFKGSIIPAADASLTLGTGSLRWNFAYINNALTVTDGNFNTTTSFKFNKGLIIEGSVDPSATGYGYYESAGTNIILKGDSVGRSGIFFESEKDGTNINDPSDYGFIQFHSYGYGNTSGEANNLVIGVANDSTDKVILQAPYNGGVLIGYKDATSGTGLTLSEVIHSNSSSYNASQWDAAEANVNADWNATSGDAQILNKPTILVPEFFEEKFAYQSNDSNTVYTPMVKGGLYGTNSSSVTGAIRIDLPTYKIAGMINFYVDIYEYTTGDTVTFRISGYAYNDTDATWHNCSVINLSDNNNDYNVRFISDTTNSKQCVTIGEVDTNWTYPQVLVRDAFSGFNTSESEWLASWNITFVTSFVGTVRHTFSDNLPYADWDRLEGKPTLVPFSGTWNGANMPGSRFGGYQANSGEVVFQQDNPSSGRMSIMTDGNFHAGENGGFYSLYSSSSYNSKAGFNTDANGVLQFTTNGTSALADFDGRVIAGDGSQAANNDAILTLNSTQFSGLDIKSARTEGNIGGLRYYDTASDTVPQSQFLVEVDGSYNFYNGTNGAQLRLKIDSAGDADFAGTVTSPKITASNPNGASNGSAQEVARFVNISTGATSSYMYIGASSGTDWRLGKNINGTAGNTNFAITKHSGTTLFFEIDGVGNTTTYGSAKATAIKTDSYQDSGGNILFLAGNATTGASRSLNLRTSGSTGDPSASDDSNSTGITWGQRSDSNPYYMIYPQLENWSSSGNYSKLTLAWHTGIKIGADKVYGGTRFYNQSPDISGAAVIMNVGVGNDNIGVVNNLTVGGSLNVGPGPSRFTDQQNAGSRLELYNNRQDAGNVEVYRIAAYNSSEVTGVHFYRGGGSSSGYTKIFAKKNNASSLEQVVQFGQDNSLTSTFSGDVTVGTGALSLSSNGTITTGGYWHIMSAASGNGYLDAGGTIFIRDKDDSNADRITIDTATGYVGMGIANTSNQRLTLAEADSNGSHIKMNNSRSGGGYWVVGVGDTNSNSSIVDPGGIFFYNGSTKLKISSGGDATFAGNIKLSGGKTVTHDNQTLYNGSSTSTQYLKILDRGLTTGSTENYMHFQLRSYNSSEYSAEVRIHIPTYAGFLTSYGTMDAGMGVQIEIKTGGLSTQSQVLDSIIECANLTSTGDNIELYLKITPPSNVTVVTVKNYADADVLVDTSQSWTTTAPSNQKRDFLFACGATRINSTVIGRPNLEVEGNILLTGPVTTTSQGRMIDFTGFDKEGITDFSDRAFISHTTNIGGHTGSVLQISSQNDVSDGIAFTTHASSLLRHNGNAIFTTGHLPTWSEIESKPTTFDPTSHQHNANEITAGVLDAARLPVNLQNVASTSNNSGIYFRAAAEGISGESWCTGHYAYNNNDGFLFLNRNASSAAVPVFHIGGYNNASYGGYAAQDSIITLTRGDGTKSSGSAYANKGLSNSVYYTNIIKTTTKTVFHDAQGLHEFTGAAGTPYGNFSVGSASDTTQRILYLHAYVANKSSTLKCSDGNLHIDSADGHALYLNYYAGASTNINFGNSNSGVCGTLSSSGLLRVGNDVVAYYSFSDKRLKKDIKTTENNLDKILSLRPVEYKWKEGPREGIKEIGLIAQEVEKVVPEVVRVQSRHDDENYDEGVDYKQVDYEHLVSTLIGAMQEQQDQINDLKKEIQTLKNK